MASSRKWAPYVFVMPFFVLFMLFFAGPILYSMGLSFVKWNGIGAMKAVGLDNYARLLKDTTFHTALKNTLFFSAVYVVSLVTISTTIALLLSSRLVRFRVFFRTAYFLPVTMALSVVAMVFDLIYSRDIGLLNLILGTLHLPADIAWLHSTNTAMWAILGMRLWRASGYYAVIILSGLLQIPREVYEVAMIDGASTLQQVRYVTLPLLRPVLGVVVVMCTIVALKLFDEPWILNKGGPSNSTLTGLIHMYRNGFLFLKLGYGAAISYALSAIMFVFSLLEVRATQGSEA